MPQQAGMRRVSTDRRHRGMECTACVANGAQGKGDLLYLVAAMTCKRNIFHDGRFSALGARPAGLRTTIMSAQCEAGVDSQAPLRHTLDSNCPRDLPSRRCPLHLPPVIPLFPRRVANEREIGAAASASTIGLALEPKSPAWLSRVRGRSGCGHPSTQYPGPPRSTSGPEHPTGSPATRIPGIPVQSLNFACQ